MASGSETHASILKIVERDQDVLHALIQTAKGPVTVFANVMRREKILHLSQVHVEGHGLTLAIMKQAARELGRLEGAVTVRIQGGRRTSGARPGTVPSLIIVEVDL